jgi:hypothetical protein
MATWQEFEQEAPELAAAVRARFTAYRHHVLATVRADGSPRVSGTEVRFDGGWLTLGSMGEALTALDLRRDPRCAIHANPGDGSVDGGDAKVAGRAVEITDPEELRAHRVAGQPPGPYHAFRMELREAVLTSVEGGDHLLIRLWRPRLPVAEFRRS